jgi:uncharacterized protein (DUF983 family)
MRMTTYEFPKSKAVSIWRGFTHACPKCGSRKTHMKYFSIKDTCPKCGLKFEREEGYWTGAMAVNIVFSAIVIALGLAIGLITTAPDIAVVPIIATLAPLTVLLPILGYPFSQTIWMGIDYGFVQKLND